MSSSVRLGVFLIIATASQLFGQGAERTVTGVVREAGTGEPLPLARVTLAGQTSVITVDGRGRFSVRAPVGNFLLTITHIGHALSTVVVSGADSTVTVVLNRVALNLDEVVISGQATGIVRRLSGTSISSVSAEDLTRVDHQSIENALQGKISGVQISQRTGAPGGGNWVRIRGISTVFGATTTPLYVVDGVIVADSYIGNGQSRLTGGAGSESPANRITDLVPDDIESIEVLKGSAASAIYGSKASGGVVLITTRRGTPGRPQWSTRLSFGKSALAYRNGHRRWSYDDAIAFFGQKAASYFDPTTHEPLVEVDYEDLAYGARPLSTDLSMSLGGGATGTRYLISGSARDEGGIVTNTGAQKRSLRANLDQVVNSRAVLQFNVAGINSSNDRALFDNENGASGNGSSVGFNLPMIPSFLDLRQRADGTWPRNPFAQTNPLENIALTRNHDDVWRGIAGAQLRATLLQSPQHELRTLLIGGADALTERYELFIPPEQQSESVIPTPGRAVVTDHRTLMTNLNANLVHAWRATERVAVTTQLGTQVERWNQKVLVTSAANLGGGLEVVNAGTQATTSVADSRGLVEDFGIFAQTEWVLDDKLAFTLGGRADRSSANADVGAFHFFPKASISWTPDRLSLPWTDLEAPDWLVSNIKFRMAYGATGNRPFWSDKYMPLSVGSVGTSTSYRPSITLKATDLHPEREEELEGGLDASLLDNNASLEFTVFRRNISDLLLTTPVAPSSGYTSAFANGGRLRVTGLELAASAIPLQSPRFMWTTRATFGQNRSRVLDLNGDTLRTAGSTPLRGQVWLQPGHSATQLMGLDSLPAPNTVTYLGDGAPRWVGGLSNELRWGGLAVYFLVDHQEGSRLWSGTFKKYDDARNARDHDATAPNGGKLGDTRRVAATKVAAIYNQDATYTKLREVTVSWSLPAVLAGRLGASRGGRVFLSGRNLFTRTNYRGGDPEAENFFGGVELQPLQHNRELGAYPASRQFWLTFQLEY